MKYLIGLTGASTLCHKGEGHQNGNMHKCKQLGKNGKFYVFKVLTFHLNIYQ